MQGVERGRIKMKRQSNSPTSSIYYFMNDERSPAGTQKTLGFRGPGTASTPFRRPIVNSRGDMTSYIRPSSVSTHTPGVRIACVKM